MGDGYLSLSVGQVALAAALILLNGFLSVLLRLRLERQIALAAARTVVQLTLLGFVLDRVFAIRHPAIVLLLAAAMTVIAGVTASRRVKRSYQGIWLTGVVSVGVSSWLVAAVAVGAVVHVRPWYDPQYAIPLLGMILGNTLNGISLGLDRLTDQLVGRRDQVEGLLALGATRWEAAHETVSDALRTGMIPILNAMMVVGVVSLPGMMTGQLLAGVAPMEAVKYQIVIMFLIAAATALGTICAVLLGYRRLFTAAHQVQWDLLR